MDTKIASIAHDIRNHYVTTGGSKLQTPDAIHLAAAILHRADEFHTFDGTLISLSGNVAGHRLTICKPIAKKRRTRPNPTNEGVGSKDSFEAVAKRLECDENEGAFEARLEKLAAAHPKVPAKAKPKKPAAMKK